MGDADHRAVAGGRIQSSADGDVVEGAALLFGLGDSRQDPHPRGECVDRWEAIVLETAMQLMATGEPNAAREELRRADLSADGGEMGEDRATDGGPCGR